MLTNFQNYFGPETIYLWLSFGVLPFWLTLIFLPNSRVSLLFISSIFLPIIFSLIYGYMIYQLITSGQNIFDSFDLYLGIENLHSLFSNDIFLATFYSYKLIFRFLGIKRRAQIQCSKIFIWNFLNLDLFCWPIGFSFILVYQNLLFKKNFLA